MTALMAILPWLIGAAFLSVVAVLFTGIIAMSLGGDFNARHGNRLMRLRVISQGVTVVLLAVYALLQVMA